MSMALNFNRRLASQHQGVMDGDLARARRDTTNNRMSACTLGLIGFGRSAVHPARRAKGFGMRVLASSQNKNTPRDEADAPGVEMTNLDTVLRELDYVSLHIPLSPSAHHIIDAAALAKMRPTAIIINTLRGSLIYEWSLVAALKEERIGGTGIDTYGLINIFLGHIPSPVHPRVGSPNVILSPHTSSASITRQN